MDPNQQPNQAPATPPQPAAPPQQPSPQTYQQAPAAPPQPPTSYDATPSPAYDPNYLDSIAPAPPRPKLFSGSFGVIFYILIGVFVLAVSLIIAFSGKDNTADLQQIAVRLDNIEKTAKTVHKDLKSNNLSTTNSNFQIWIKSNAHDANELLQKAGVKKTQYDKKMIASEKAITDDLDKKFEDARLNAKLDRVYARTMASETLKIINLYNAMSKNSGAKAIREYAKDASKNLAPIQKSFDSYVDNGN